MENVDKCEDATMRILSQSRSSGLRVIIGLFLTAAVGLAQTPGWRSANDPAPGSSPSADPSTPVASPDQGGLPQGPPPALPGQDQGGLPQGPPSAVPPPNAGLPVHLTIPAGKFINVRIDQVLSTSHNQAGDLFSATVIDPIVIDGLVVVQRGQHVAGQVTLSDKGGRVSGVARLGLQLTELTAVDGQQLPVRTQFISRNAPSTAGRDAGVIAGSTALGAAVGAAAAWGTGAAIGAGAGAALGIAGVLLTRGAPAVVYPETPLTFRVEQAVDVDTTHAPQAFQPMNPAEYQQPQFRTGPAGPGPAGPYPGGPYPYATPYAYGYGYSYPYPYAYGGYPYPYYYPYYPYFWGPGFGVVIGRGFYGPGFYGFRGGFRR
jgi:hypothetical protein